MTAYTDRTLPGVWQACQMCGHAAGFPLPHHPHSALCPDCTRWAVLQDAARESLATLTAPVLGAWAAQWSAAGVPLEDLEVITEHLSGAGMDASAGRAYRTRHLRALRREHRAPPFEVAPPDRVTLDAPALPTLTRYTPADTARGVPRPYFLDSEGRPHTFPLGCDSLTVNLPDGDALLIFTGLHGMTDLCPVPGLAHAFRVPAQLLPQVRAALSGEREEVEL